MARSEMTWLKGVKQGASRRGYKAPQTLQKELKRQLLAQQVMAHRERMTAAQIEHACGVNYMVLRHPDGTFTRATDESQVEAACAIGASAFKIFTQTPNPSSLRT